MGKLYHNLDFEALTPYIQRYFTPSQEIQDIAHSMEIKLSQQVYCAVYYRGTDKRFELTLGSHEQYFRKMEQIAKNDPAVAFIVQSDDAIFVKSAHARFRNIIVLDNAKPKKPSAGIHIENTPEENYIAIKHFFAALLVISKCSYIVCSGSNCSIWMLLYRGHSKNVSLWQDDQWHEIKTVDSDISSSSKARKKCVPKKVDNPDLTDVLQRLPLPPTLGIGRRPMPQRGLTERKR